MNANKTVSAQAALAAVRAAASAHTLAIATWKAALNATMVTKPRIEVAVEAAADDCTSAEAEVTGIGKWLHDHEKRQPGAILVGHHATDLGRAVAWRLEARLAHRELYSSTRERATPAVAAAYATWYAAGVKERETWDAEIVAHHALDAAILALLATNNIDAIRAAHGISAEVANHIATVRAHERERASNQDRWASWFTIAAA